MYFWSSQFPFIHSQENASSNIPSKSGPYVWGGFFFYLGAVNRTRDSLGLKETRGALQSHLQSVRWTKQWTLQLVFREENTSPLGLSNTGNTCATFPSLLAIVTGTCSLDEQKALKMHFCSQRQQQQLQSCCCGERRTGAGSYTNVALSAPHRKVQGTSGHFSANLKADLSGLLSLSPRNRFLSWPYLTAETTAVKYNMTFGVVFLWSMKSPRPFG